MSTPPLLSAEECALYDAGHTWDAIRVPHPLGLAAMRILGRGSVMAIPAERRTDGPGAHWLICPGEDGWLTDPAALAAALGDSVASHGPE
ncbi:hypothetical protein [Streptomyces sp. 4F14]|uniref:hypothetical protein n=1 Tax=Streptomyces sp. 4F14 TaxID=3394380 RepID=UPI003A8AD7EB